MDFQAVPWYASQQFNYDYYRGTAIQPLSILAFFRNLRMGSNP